LGQPQSTKRLGARNQIMIGFGVSVTIVFGNPDGSH
jgi:hypothetical protein